VYTFQEIAEAFGYADRRNVHNYWREFVACGQEFFAFVRRKRKVDDIVVAAVEAELRTNLWSSLSALCAGTNQRLGRSDVTVANIQAALEQIPCSVIRDVVISKWEAGRFQPKAGRFQPKEEVILEEVMAALETGEPGPQERARECLSGIGITPRDEDLEDRVQVTQWEWVIGLAMALWPVIQGWIISQVRASHLYLDEKWLKIRGT
jgi:hypothetical protein